MYIQNNLNQRALQSFSSNSRLQEFQKIGIFKDFPKFSGKNVCFYFPRNHQKPFSIKFKTRLQQKCFLVNFEKFIRKSSSRYNSEQLLLYIWLKADFDTKYTVSLQSSLMAQFYTNESSLDVNFAISIIIVLQRCILLFHFQCLIFLNGFGLFDTCSEGHGKGKMNKMKYKISPP